MVDSIIKGFEVWTDAQGVKSKGRVKCIDNISLEGIARLRELILDFAIRGKLVPQKHYENPAEDLFKKLNAAREKLVKEGKIKNNKPKTNDVNEGNHVQLPKNWKVTSLIDVFDVRDGTHDSPKYQSEGYPLITSKNLYNGQLDFNDVNYISEVDHLKISERSKVERYDILFAMIGSIGNPVIVDTDREFSIKNVALFKYYDKDLSCPEFLQIFLKHATVEMKAKALGGVQSFVSLGMIREFKFYLPPLEEQTRIVAKVKELISLCDKLEAEQTKNLTTHHHLVKCFLETLTQANDADELQILWEKISQHFDTLFCTEDSIVQLKQTILQLALMGRLVKQNLKNERAKDELKKITEEKEILIKVGEIRKQSPLPEITDKDIKFQIPSNWCLSRLEDLVSVLGDGIHGTPEYDDNGDYYFVNGNNLNDGQIEIRFDTKTVSESEFIKHKRNLNERTILVSINGTIGKTAFYNNEKIILGKSACYFNLMNGIDKDYIRLILNTKYFLEYAFSEATGTTIKNVSLKTMRSFVIPLPPFNEQVKIIKEVSRLIEFCDELINSIFKSEGIKILLSKKAIEMN